MGVFSELIEENEQLSSQFENKEEAKEVIESIDEKIDDFNVKLKTFVESNSDQFLAPTKEETKKNIKVFSEVAMAQFVNECRTILSNEIGEGQEVNESGNGSLSDYI